MTLTASTDLELAIAAAATQTVLVSPDDVNIELRGGGNASARSAA